MFDNVAKAFKFDEKSVVKQIISNIAELRRSSHRPSTRRSPSSQAWTAPSAATRASIQAQAAIADDAQKDAFGLAYSLVSQLWEASARTRCWREHEADYRWLTDVYESVRPSDITGRLVWHALGAKTLDLINQHVQVEVPQR